MGFHDIETRGHFVNQPGFEFSFPKGEVTTVCPGYEHGALETIAFVRLEFVILFGRPDLKKAGGAKRVNAL